MANAGEDKTSRVRREGAWFAATVALSLLFVAFCVWRVVDCGRRGGFPHSPFLCVKRSCVLP